MMGLLTGKASEMVVEEGKEVVSFRAMPCLELRENGSCVDLKYLQAR